MINGGSLNFSHLNLWLLGASSLLIASCASPHTPAPVSQVYRGATFHEYQQDSWSAETYEVRAGDTLYSIAFRANMDMREITRINNLQEPYTIYPGQVLRLRGGSPGQTSDIASDVPVRQNGNNNSEIAQRNDLTEPVASTSQAEYGETVTEEKESEIQPITEPTQRRERQIRNADLRWRWPSSGEVTRRFSTQSPTNNGLEFRGNRGDAVVAAEAGKVVYTGTALRGYGRLIIMKHNDDYITAYGHNDEILVREQQWVEAGEQISTMGSSGRSDVRLRFEMRFRGNSVNPENYLPRSR